VHMTKLIKKELEYLVPVLTHLPDGQHVDIEEHDNEIRIGMQCWTQAEARATRRCFPGTTWEKRYQAGDLNWWEYHGKWNGLVLKIYACHEAPPTCRMSKRIVEVEERIPIEFETRMVPKVVIEWKCDGEVVEEAV